jgi:hypothetical protein
LVEAGSASTFYRRFAGWAVAAAIAASAGFSIAADFIYRYRSGEIPHAVHQFRRLDEFFESAAGGQGVFLHYSGVGEPERTFTLVMYMRAIYRLYPQPVLTAEPGVLIATPDELLGANSDRDGTWMMDHGVGHEISLEFDPSGKLSYQLIPAEPAK